MNKEESWLWLIPGGASSLPLGREDVASEVGLFHTKGSLRLVAAKSAHSSPNSRVRGAAILFSGLQLAIFVLIALYLLKRVAALHQRNRRLWAEIVESLLPGLGAKQDDSAAEIDRRFTNGAIEGRAASAQGRRQMFDEAGVMMEMADYAERNGGVATAPAVASVRNHAAAIRIATAKSLLAHSGGKRRG